MAVTKNKALWIAATDVVEIVERLGAALTPELRKEFKFAIEVARAIEKGYLSGNGTAAVVRILGAAYTELSAAYWEHCEEIRKANEAHALHEKMAKAVPTLDDVLAETAALYSVGNKLSVRHEKWAAPRAAEIVRRNWRDAGALPAAWVYTLKTDDGEYAWAETDLDWDVDFVA